MRRAAFALGLLVSVLIGPAAVAQSVVGTSLVEGRKVELMSDNTWRYAAVSPDNCDDVRLGVRFCSVGTKWSRSVNANPAASATYQWSDRTFAMYIVEGVGTDDGFDVDGFTQIALGYVATAQKTEIENVPVLSIEPVELGDIPGQTVVYSGLIRGVSVVYINSIFVQADRSLQIVTFGVGLEPTEEMQAAHASLIENTRL